MLDKKESRFFKFKISYLASTGANCILLSMAVILAFRYVLKACFYGLSTIKLKQNGGLPNFFMSSFYSSFVLVDTVLF